MRHRPGYLPPLGGHHDSQRRGHPWTAQSSNTSASPRTTVYLAKQRRNGKSNREAIRSLKRNLVRRVYHLLRDPIQVPTIITC
jgi:hypothetical protein